MLFSVLPLRARPRVTSRPLVRTAVRLLARAQNLRPTQKETFYFFRREPSYQRAGPARSGGMPRGSTGRLLRARRARNATLCLRSERSFVRPQPQALRPELAPPHRLARRAGSLRRRASGLTGLGSEFISFLFFSFLHLCLWLSYLAVFVAGNRSHFVFTDGTMFISVPGCASNWCLRCLISRLQFFLILNKLITAISFANSPHRSYCQLTPKVNYR